jgi:hypothetical protein
LKRREADGALLFGQLELRIGLALNGDSRGNVALGETDRLTNSAQPAARRLGGNVLGRVEAFDALIEPLENDLPNLRYSAGFKLPSYL